MFVFKFRKVLNYVNISILNTKITKTVCDFFFFVFFINKEIYDGVVVSVAAAAEHRRNF